MTSIERTAYPRFSKYRPISDVELRKFYTPTREEVVLIDQLCKEQTHRLNFTLLYKTFQRLSYFPDFKDIPDKIIHHLRAFLSISTDSSIHYESDRTQRHHQQSIRELLNVSPFNKEAMEFAIKTALTVSQTKNNPADIMNVVIEELIHHHYELPPYPTLDRLVRHARAQMNNSIFKKISERLSPLIKTEFEALLQQTGDYNRTGFNQLKNSPKRATITHFMELLSHHEWLISFGNMQWCFTGITKIKLQQFANEAKSLDASNLRDITIPKRYALIASLLYQMQLNTKDGLVTMFCRTIRRIHQSAKEKLERLRIEHGDKLNNLLYLLSDILIDANQTLSPEVIGKMVLDKCLRQGGSEALLRDCEQIIAYHSQNHLFLLAQFLSKRKRTTLFKLLRVLDIQSTTQDQALKEALNFILEREHDRNDFIACDPDISFASKDWIKLIVRKKERKTTIFRKHFELCVFSYLATYLKSGDLCVKGSEAYSDYRDHLLDWESCDAEVSSYCKTIGISDNPKDFVSELRQRLEVLSKKVDQKYPEIEELVIDKDGSPTLKRRKAKTIMPKTKRIMQEITRRMPERDLVEILCNTHHYTGWANFFGPLSGSEPKIDNSIEKYILTAFAYGTSMGATQAARHISGVSPHMLSWINRRHVSSKILDKSLTVLINACSDFMLIKAWGDGSSCAADGTFCSIYQENLLAEYHIRYGNTGGIAYHHVSDTYVALFSTFIPCGVWEAVEIIEAFMQNESEIQPDTVHSDTQGQSTPVFALSYLLGIKLMPRIRNWKDLILYRPYKGIRYEHIDSLFSGVIDWELIEAHWKDLIQVVISIKQGKISTSVLLRKLTSYSTRNRLYLAFQELGRVIRTLFLLEYISNVTLREKITDTTNKTENYNQLASWLHFAFEYVIVASNDAVEQEKAIKYNTLIANAVILQNIIDMTDIVYQLIQESHVIGIEDLQHMSPYIREHIKRFGNYVINLNKTPRSISELLHIMLWN